MASEDKTPMLRYMVYLPSNIRALAYPIRISEDAEVNELIEKICKHRVFKGIVGSEEVYLYKCGTLADDPSKDVYKDALEWLHKQPKKSAMRPGNCLKQYFPKGPACKGSDLIDVIVATTEILETIDKLHPLPGNMALKLSKERLALAERLGSLPSPSDCVSNAGGVEKCNESNGIHAHRPATNCGPPTFLFNPALAKLKHRLDHLSLEIDESEPQSITLSYSHTFLLAVSQFYKSEKNREDALKNLVDKLIGINGSRQQLTENGVKPDTVWGDPPVMIEESKNEYGIGGNASLQGVISYAKILVQNKYKDLIQKSNCPVIIFSLMGTQLEISTAVFVDGIYVDKLLSLELRFGGSEADSVLHLGRIMSVLSDAVSDLLMYYKNLLPDPSSASSQSQPSKSGPAKLDPSKAGRFPAHLFPDPVFVGGRSKPDLVYTGKLSRNGIPIDITRMGSLGEERRHALYLAKMGDDERAVVVKFTFHYHEHAHRILAQKGLAPALHFCAPILGGAYMVVMDYVGGQSPLTANKSNDYRKIYQDIKLAVEVLHAEDLVFGDLRLQNIICKPEGGAVLIDFDWVGKHQVDRYSAALNESVRWADGVGRRTVMDKAHDLFMLKRVKDFVEGIEKTAS